MSKPATRQAAADPWGEPAGGLAASLTAAKTRFRADEPVLLRYRVKNVSKEPRTVWHCGFWPNHRLVVTDVDGHDVPLTDLGRTVSAAFAPDGSRRKNAPLELAPAAEDVQQDALDLRLYFNLPTGAPLHIRWLCHDGALKFWSNELNIEIAKP